MNEDQTRAAAEVLELANRLPQTGKITYEAKGIVGGDFTVTAKRVSALYSPGEYVYEVTVTPND
jgi:hypothetical protein